MRATLPFILPIGLFFVSIGCGDIIRGPRNPKADVADIPNENVSPQLGRCANFSGSWTPLCTDLPANAPSKLQLMQHSCELFQFLQLASFNLNDNNQSVAWSESQTEVTLADTKQSFQLRMLNGQREGTWTLQTESGAKVCPLHWWPL